MKNTAFICVVSFVLVLFFISLIVRIYRDYDCKDFKTQAEAQRMLDAYGYDRYGLDGDHDGISCERLP